jgi:urease beta subunit
MISHFRLSETGWDISFFFLWERGFRRDINVYKVIKFKPGEERKRKKTGISTDRRRRTYIWVRDDQQLYRKHFFQKWTIYPEV